MAPEDMKNPEVVVPAGAPAGHLSSASGSDSGSDPESTSVSRFCERASGRGLVVPTRARRAGRLRRHWRETPASWLQRHGSLNACAEGAPQDDPGGGSLKAIRCPSCSYKREPALSEDRHGRHPDGARPPALSLIPNLTPPPMPALSRYRVPTSSLRARDRGSPRW